MRKELLGAFALVLLLAPRADAFVLGYNQAWIEGKYGRDLSAGFDADDWRRVLRRTRDGGGTALRVWLFEGKLWEGVVWEGRRPLRPDPTFLANVRTVSALAAEERVAIYWTAVSGNWGASWGPRTGIEAERIYNVLNDRFDCGRGFRERVLGPVLDAIRAGGGPVHGFDLMNEVQGATRTWLFTDGWDGARTFLRQTAAFVHARAPGVKVTASSGHHSAARDILDGRFDGVGLDFLDIHVYTNAEEIPDGAALVAHARRRGVPIVLGELGESSEDVDDARQARLVRAHVASARRLGFAAAFAWRLEDGQPRGRHFSFWNGDRPRPALEEMRRIGRDLAARKRSKGLVGALDE